MVFSSISFLFMFLPFVFIVYQLLPGIAAKNLFLTLCSLFFYAWGEPVYVFLMLICVAFNYIFGLLLHKFSSKKNHIIVLSIIFNVGILLYYKYFAFFIDTINLLPFIDFNTVDIRLPIGISFFTFQAMSYVFDVAKNEANVQKNPLNLLLYISLFPQLIAGPIVKYHDVDQQIKSRSCSLEKTKKGVLRFVIGLSKKVIIANQMAIICDTIFAAQSSQLNIISTWIAAVAYVFQIYFDFSGYSDMAIGLGKMFGFEFKENFNYPLQSSNIKEFWNRWHISLSNWLKEYIYIPLGGNRRSASRNYINVMIVFFTTGFWHGANFTFIVWGLIHGVFLCLENSGIIPINKIKSQIIRHIYLLLFITVTFVIFRSDSIGYAYEFIKTMFIGFDFQTYKTAIATQFLSPYTIIIFIAAIITSNSYLKDFIKSKFELNKSKPASFILASTTLVLYLICISFLALNTYNPFIYFRF